MIIKLTDYSNHRTLDIEINKIVAFGKSESLTPTILTIDGEIVATVVETYNQIMEMINKNNRRKV